MIDDRLCSIECFLSIAFEEEKEEEPPACQNLTNTSDQICQNKIYFCKFLDTSRAQVKAFKCW